MAKGSGKHYVKQKKKTFFTRREKQILLGILIAAAVIIALILAINAITDKSIDVKDGKLVGIEDNWIIANAGDVDDPEYYKYGSYDLAALEALEAEVVPGSLGYDALSTCIDIYPSGVSNANIYVYASHLPVEDVVNNVTSQMEYLITDGEVFPAEEFEDGYIYWYNTRVDSETEDGESTSVYRQVFTGYMPAENDGTIVIRATIEFGDDTSYLDYEQGCDAVADIWNCITVE